MKGALDALREQRERQFDERQAGADDPETFYAEKVEGSLRKTAEGFIETGQLAS